MKPASALFIATVFACASLNCAAAIDAQRQNTARQSPITQTHLREVHSLLQRHALPHARVTLDRHGRVALSGEYANREEVEIAHSIVQSVVGVIWTSFVTPEHIRLTNLQKGSQSVLRELFAAAAKGAARTEPTQAPAPPVNGSPGLIRKRFALVIGVGQFASKISKLAFAASDAIAVASYLRTANGTKFRNDDIALMVDGDATSGSVLAWLDRVEREAEPDDFVFIYASTHGSRPDSEGLMAVVTHDTVYDPPTHARLRQSSVTGSRLSAFVRNLRAKRLLIVLDTCYSASALAALPGYKPRDAVALGIDDEAFGVGDDAAAKMLGSKDLVRDDEPLLTRVPNTNPAPEDAWGRVIITASGPAQRSWESTKRRASIFTYHFVQGLQATSNVRDAYRYAREVVPGEVLMEYKQLQTPTVYANRREWAYAF